MSFFWAYYWRISDLNLTWSIDQLNSKASEETLIFVQGINIVVESQTLGMLCKKWSLRLKYHLWIFARRIQLGLEEKLKFSDFCLKHQLSTSGYSSVWGPVVWDSGVPLSNTPFQGILGIQTTNPNQHLTIGWSFWYVFSELLDVLNLTLWGPSQRIASFHDYVSTRVCTKVVWDALVFVTGGFFHSRPWEVGYYNYNISCVVWICAYQIIIWCLMSYYTSLYSHHTHIIYHIKSYHIKSYHITSYQIMVSNRKRFISYIFGGMPHPNIQI